MAKKLTLGWSEYFKPTPPNVKLFFDSAAISLTTLTTTFADSVVTVKVMMVVVGMMMLLVRYIGAKEEEVNPEEPEPFEGAKNL